MDKKRQEYLIESAEKYAQLASLYDATNPKEECFSFPHQFFVEVTNLCNCRCEMCMQRLMKRQKGKIDFELMKKIIDEVAFFDPYFDFCKHGEPLLHPEIVEMISYGVQRGLTKTRLITNGKLLSQDMSMDIVKSGLKKINISFNGYDKKSYERYQKGANFEQTLKNIFDLLRVRHEMKSQTPKIEISLVLYDELSNNRKRFFQMFDKLPVDRMRVSTMINFFGKNKESALDENVKKPYSQWPTCKVPFRFFNINWDGDVTPCIIDYDKKYSIGNVAQDKVLDIWNGEKMRFFRKCHIEKKFDVISKKSNGVFCEYCGSLWMNNKDNGPQYPETFQMGADDFFSQQQSMFGRFERDVFKDKAKIQSQYEDFIKNSDQIYEDILRESV